MRKKNIWLKRNALKFVNNSILNIGYYERTQVFVPKSIFSACTLQSGTKVLVTSFCK